MRKTVFVSIFCLFSLLLASCYGPKYYVRDGELRIKGFRPLATDYNHYDKQLMIDDPLTFHKVGKNHIADAKYVYYHQGSSSYTTKLQDADLATFRVLQDDYSCDASHVWFQGRLLPDANPSELRILTYGYACTDSAVYYLFKKIKGDPQTFVVHATGYTEDANDVYWDQYPLHVCDKESFRILPRKPHKKNHWAKDKQYVYYMLHSRDSVIVRSPIADYDSFEEIDHYYARDKEQVYYCDTIVENANPATFRYVGRLYCQDDAHVFFKGKKVCDYTASFMELNNSCAKDSLHVYYREKTIEGADPVTFRLEKASYACDTSQVYFEGSIVEGANPSTFRYLGSLYAQDSTQVYYEGKFLCDATPSDRFFSRFYFTNGIDLYYLDKKVEGVDLATFQVLGPSSWSKDKNQVYYEGTIVPDADSETFHLEFVRKEIFDADSTIIGTESYLCGKDKFRQYSEPKINRSFLQGAYLW